MRGLNLGGGVVHLQEWGGQLVGHDVEDVWLGGRGGRGRGGWCGGGGGGGFGWVGGGGDGVEIWCHGGGLQGECCGGCCGGGGGRLE